MVTSLVEKILPQSVIDCVIIFFLFCSEMDEDICRLKTTAVSLLNDLGCNGSTLTEDLINEMCRYGAAELHAVAAFIGGIASQEVIKVSICVFLSSMFSIQSCENHVVCFLNNIHSFVCKIENLTILFCLFVSSLKLITRQFVPMPGTFIFNGIDHKSQLLFL